MKKVIKATDGRTALLRDGQVAIIGYVYHLHYRMVERAELEPVSVVEMDFEGNGKKDLFYFENDKLVYHNLSESPSLLVRKIYQEVTKVPGCDLNTFLVVVSHSYASEMVFGDAFKE
jgi:hypothetical protein